MEQFAYWKTPAWSRQPNGTIFAPMALTDYVKLQALFRETASLLESMGVKWQLSHGSLLGAWLHHSPVPWDEEADIILLPEDFAALEERLGPPPGTSGSVASMEDGRLWVYEGPIVGSLQYDYHEHVDRAGHWLATVITFRLAADSRDSQVRVDAFLAKTNGTHAWTDSAVLPLDVLLPSRWLRYYDFLAPAPHDPEAALLLWYGDSYATKRRCGIRVPLGDPDDVDSAVAAAAGSHIKSIAEVPGKAIQGAYPVVLNEWIDGIDGRRLFCTVHQNGKVLWTLVLDTLAGKALPAPGDAVIEGVLPGPTVVLQRLSSGPKSIGRKKPTAGAQKHFVKGLLPEMVPNLWLRPR